MLLKATQYEILTEQSVRPFLSLYARMQVDRLYKAHMVHVELDLRDLDCPKDPEFPKESVSL